MCDNLKKFCCPTMEEMIKIIPGPIQCGRDPKDIGFASRNIRFCPFCGINFGKVACEELKNSDFCCRKMMCNSSACDASDEFDIYYHPWARRYFFSTCKKWKWYDVNYEEWDFNYCIYCGKKLPTSLLVQWIKIVQDETGMIPKIETQELLDQTLAKLPEELKTDAWWKKRGL